VALGQVVHLVRGGAPHYVNTDGGHLGNPLGQISTRMGVAADAEWAEDWHRCLVQAVRRDRGSGHQPQTGCGRGQRFNGSNHSHSMSGKNRAKSSDSHAVRGLKQKGGNHSDLSVSLAGSMRGARGLGGKEKKSKEISAY
jgi:hypothetical protein